MKDKNVIADALQSLVDHGIAQSRGEKLIVNAEAWKFLNKHFENVSVVKPTYEIEVDFNEK